MSRLAGEWMPGITVLAENLNQRFQLVYFLTGKVDGRLPRLRVTIRDQPFHGFAIIFLLTSLITSDISFLAHGQYLSD